MDIDWDWIDERVGTVVRVAAFGGELEVTVEVSQEALDAFEEAQRGEQSAAHVGAGEPVSSWDELEAQLEAQGALDFDDSILDRISDGVFPGEGPALDTLVRPEQAAALEGLLERQAEVHAALVAGLRDIIEAQEEERRRQFEEQDRLEAEHRRQEIKANRPYGWDQDEDPQGWDDDDDYGAGLFDDPDELEDEDEDEGEDEARPFQHRFTIDRLHISLPDANGQCSWRFGGSCDWDEEHGLGVRMEGRAVMEVGSLDLLR
jgi:hypothetical protein